ncbi:MAG: hypothetical protein L3J49_04510 [Desulfobulbaceae bacterium]|nr:hypothetical protein [Desulfobulbaceae bacterium]
MGLGKTVQALSAILLRAGHGPAGRVQDDHDRDTGGKPSW